MKGFKYYFKKRAFIYSLFICVIVTHNYSNAEMFRNDLQSFPEYKYRYSTVGIKTVNGKFYAYIVLLFNENPHFVNIIQKGTVSIKEIGNEGFHVKAYRNYLSSIQDKAHYDEAVLLLNLYNAPAKFSEAKLQEIADALAKRNIILKFRKEGYNRMALVTLDYCIYGAKVKINVKHPFLDYNEDIYYIKPFIYYDEFSTSNSTFYYDMIYINPEEVENDYIIARDILRGKEVRSMFFVGSRVDEDIKASLLRAFTGSSDIKNEIWRMFVIHEITHKLLDNHFNNDDQVSGEEISMSSTIYANPYLGLAVLYSYLNYSNDNPHRLAALNFVAFAADTLENKELLDNPGLLRNLSHDKLRDLARSHFLSGIKRLKNNSYR
jgi:hypothetical protein